MIDSDLLTMRIFELVITSLTAILASSGFWLYFERKRTSNAAIKQMLLGLAHVRIVELSMEYIGRGCITQDEHECLIDYLYKPYKALGGNGATDRLIKEVDSLPLQQKRC